MKDCAQEEGDSRLSPSSTRVAEKCVRDEVDSRYCHHHHVWIWLNVEAAGRLEQL